MRLTFRYFHLCFFFLLVIALSLLLSGSSKFNVIMNAPYHKQMFNWQAYKGTHIKVLCNDHPWTEILFNNIHTFSEKTGIIVEPQKFPEDQFRVKRLVEMLSGIGIYDVFMIQPGQSMCRYTKEQWVVPLNRFMIPGLLSPGFDVNDFFPAALATGKRDDVFYSLPLILETSLLSYNKKIFSQYNISIPGTMEQLEDACKKITHRSGGRIYGITLRGNGVSATSQWVDFLHSFGGEWLDKTGNASLCAPEAVAATGFYGRLLRLYGPKNASDNSWYESISVFMQGKAAMVYDANVFRMEYENPDKSAVAGNVGYAPLPKGPRGFVPHVSSWALSISSQSQKKEAAWYFILWAAGKDMALEGMKKGLPAARRSAWNYAEQQDNETYSEWIKASLISYTHGTQLWNPPVIQVAACRDIAGEAITAAILGEDVKKACEKSSAKIDEILRIKK